MYKYHARGFFRSVLRSSIIFLSVVLLMGLGASGLHAHDAAWDISIEYSEGFPSPFDISPKDFPKIDVILYINASATIKTTSPSGAGQEINVTNIGEDGFTDVLVMNEAGTYQIEEKYTLVITDNWHFLGDAGRTFVCIDAWTYNNPAPSLILFTLEDMYVDSYSAQIDSDFLEIVLPITPEPARLGDDILVRARVIAEIHAGDNILNSLSVGARVHKTSSLTPVQDNESPVIYHNPVSTIQAGSPIEAKVTDNLKVQRVILYFKAMGSSSFKQIDMLSTDVKDIYRGYIPFNAREGNGQYYIAAWDVAGNTSQRPARTIYVEALDFGDVNGDGFVNNNDALMVLGKTVGLQDLTPDKRILADVSGNGVIGARDAGYIFQYKAGTISLFPVQAGGSGASGIIMASDVVLNVPNSAGRPGESITIPINISNTTGLNIIGISLTLTYDPDILTATGISTAGTIAPGWFTAHNITSGQIVIAMANATALTGAGALIKVNFSISGAASDGEISPLTISSVSINEGGVSAGITNGVFTVEEYYDIDIPLYEGWNIVSIPVAIENTARSVVLGPAVEALCESIWSYDANPGWKRHVYNGPPQYNNLNAIVPGKGYLLKMTGSATLSVTGKKLANTTIPLVPGRNLVGYSSPNPRSPQAVLSGMPEGTAIWTYNGLTGTWLTYLVGLFNFPDTISSFEPGKGYWIYTPVPHSWTISP